MELTFLGTAAAEGIPGIFCACDLCREAMRRGEKDIRTRSQAMLDDTLLIDLPPDSFLHMLREKRSLADFEHILFTHTHSDHLLPSELYYRRPGFCDTRVTMTLYGNDALKRKMDALVTDTGTTYEKSRLACKELTAFTEYRIADYAVIPLLANHDKSEKCLIYLIGKDGRWLLYGNDTGIFPDATWQFLAGRHLNLVSLDCTCGKTAEGSNHMGVPDIIRVRQRLIDMGSADTQTGFIATHFSHNGGVLHSDLEALLLDHGFLVAYDGLRVTV